MKEKARVVLSPVFSEGGLFLWLLYYMWSLLFPERASRVCLPLNTEEWYPYTYVEGDSVTGTAVEIVKRMAKKADVRYAIITGP